MKFLLHTIPSRRPQITKKYLEYYLITDKIFVYFILILSFASYFTPTCLFFFKLKRPTLNIFQNSLAPYNHNINIFCCDTNMKTKSTVISLVYVIYDFSSFIFAHASRFHNYFQYDILFQG